jgi:hypothetical protein
MDTTPQIPPVTTDEAGTIRVGGRWPMTPSLCRQRHNELMRAVEDGHGDEVTHPHFGAMSTPQPVLLARELWCAAWKVVCRERLSPDVLRTLVPAPAGEPA